MSIKVIERSTPASWLTELPPMGMDAKSIAADFRRYFSHTLGRDRHTKYAHYMYEALVLTLRDRLWERWKDTRYAYEEDSGVRRAYYLSMEFLMGRALSNEALASYRFRIEGHTDNVGAVADNMALSNDRAFTVMGYLQGKGIAAGRLSFKGLGPTKPIKPNDTPEGRAENRRTEFVIVSR